MELTVIQVVISAALQIAGGLLVGVFVKQLWDGTLESGDEFGRYK